MKLIEIREIKNRIIIETGLHIGAGNDEIKIGGIDNPVIRNPKTNLPYIPGSSIKGKVRTLLEWDKGQIGKKGGPLSSEVLRDLDIEPDNNLILRIFGNGAPDDDYKGGPTRASFSDCNLENYDELIKRNALTEDKIEVVIDRRSGTVGGSGPRHMERVPAGAVFDFSVTFKIFDINEDKGETDLEAYNLLEKGLKMLQKDALGGCTSRGYGRFKFEKELKHDKIWPDGQEK